MATRFLLRRLPPSHLRNLNRSTATTTDFSYFLRRNCSCPRDESLSRSSPNNGDNDVWSKLGGRTFNFAEEANIGDWAFGSAEAAEEVENRDRAFGSAKEAGNREWSIYEREVLKDIDSTVELANEILHSGRYNCGDKLSPEDEKEVMEKLLAYHPHREDKIGCGLDSIMMDKHPVYTRSRCFFVMRVDCSMEDFSYRKCLASYVRQKYPYEAEGLIWKLRQFFWREENDVCFGKMIG